MVRVVRGTSGRLLAGSSCHQCKTRRISAELVYCAQSHVKKGRQRKRQMLAAAVPVGARQLRTEAASRSDCAGRSQQSPYTSAAPPFASVLLLWLTLCARFFALCFCASDYCCRWSVSSFFSCFSSPQSPSRHCLVHRQPTDSFLRVHTLFPVCLSVSVSVCLFPCLAYRSSMERTRQPRLDPTAIAIGAVLAAEDCVLARRARGSRASGRVRGEVWSSAQAAAAKEGKLLGAGNSSSTAGEDAKDGQPPVFSSSSVGATPKVKQEKLDKAASDAIKAELSDSRK